MWVEQSPPPMRIKWTRILFRLFGLELLAKELIKLLANGLHSLKKDIKKRLVAWAIKVATKEFSWFQWGA
jgi:hypothetical protein